MGEQSGIETTIKQGKQILKIVYDGLFFYWKLSREPF